MAKKQKVLVHPLTCADAIKEYHERVSYLLMTAQTARDILGNQNMPPYIIERTIKELGERIDAIRECYGSDED